MTHRPVAATFVCAAFVLSWPAPADAAAKPPWEQIRHEEGVKVWRRVTKGSLLVEFKGTALVKSSLAKAIAVISVADRLCEWRDRCDKAYRIEQKDVDRQIVYYRLDSPPLIADRDVIVEATCRADGKGGVLCPFKSVKHRKDPKPSGVVRMPTLKGHWRIVPKGSGRVEVTYSVKADPGGWIPMWIYNMASKKLPFEALRGLRRQVKKDYEADLARIQARLDDELRPTVPAQPPVRVPLRAPR